MSPFISVRVLRFLLAYLAGERNIGDLTPVLEVGLSLLPDDNVRRLLEKPMRLMSKDGVNGSGVDDMKKGLEEADLFDFLDGVEGRQSEVFSEYNKCLEYISWNWRRSILKDSVLRIVSAVEGEIEVLGAVSVEDDFCAARFDELQKLLLLSDDEVEVLAFLYIKDNTPDFGRLWNILGIDGMHRGNMINTLRGIRLFTGLSESAIRRALSNKSALRKYDIIEKDYDVNSNYLNFMEGMTEEPLLSQFFRKFNGDAIELSTHPVSNYHVDIIRRIILNRGDDESVHILLYGKAGSGKTEFCRSLAKDVGMDIYEINTMEVEDRPSSGKRFRFAAIKACHNSIDRGRGMILVDEADDLLNAQSVGGFFSISSNEPRHAEKDMVNDILDNSAGVYFWITNHTRGIEESTKRRFDYSIEFTKFTLAQRRYVWRSAAAKHGLGEVFSDDEIAELSKKFAVNAGGIEIALKNYKRLAFGKDGQNPSTDMQAIKLSIIERILRQHMMLTDGRLKRDECEPAKNYSLKCLNIKGNISAKQVIGTLKAFHSQIVQDGTFEVKNMNLLLYGPPGSGKTEFAKFAAQEIGCPLMIRRGSDLLGMYVGETEHNIRTAFMEAQGEQAVLLIDEADGLISERTNAFRNWERTQTNEFLSSMEEFRGILICATNFRKNLDSASIRRFGMKLEFDYLSKDGKLILLKEMLAGLMSKSPVYKEFQRFEGIEHLTPGDFKVVRQNILVSPEGRRSFSKIMDDLESEVKSKLMINTAGKIGFR